MRRLTCRMMVMLIVGWSGLAMAQDAPTPPVSENPYGEDAEETPPDGEGEGEATEEGTEAESSEQAGEGAEGEGATEGEEAGEGDELRHAWDTEGEETTEAATTSTTTTATPPPASSAVSGDDDDDGGIFGDIPLGADLHGYARVRAVWMSNVPTIEGTSVSAADAGYIFQRVRLEPRIRYGPDPDRPIASLNLTIDGLDNLVWGDNERLASTPLFAGDPTNVDIEGLSIDTIKLRRAWLEFLIPVGQVRIGRMPSQWGLGLLANDGNGLGDWGDPQFGSTFDRILFATQPLTIVNTLTGRGSAPTPLITAVAYDQLVEDPLQDPSAGVDEDPLDPEFRAVPWGWLTEGDDDVQQFVAAVLWNDPDFHAARVLDELRAGIYYVHRWQTSTESYVHIFDVWWKLLYALGPNLPSIYTEGEIVTIQGESRAISLAGGCGTTRPDGTFDIACNSTNANIWGGAMRVGAVDRQEQWRGFLEVGFSTGDSELFMDDSLTMRPNYPDYHVGLLMYQVAILAATSRLTEEIRPLWSRGGVWNSKYINPQFRLKFFPGFEAHAGFLVAWADELLEPAYNSGSRPAGDRQCGIFSSDCFLGWEVDLALRVLWGEGDLMHWDNEFGIMHAGTALDGPLSESLLWTFQSRIAMIW